MRIYVISIRKFTQHTIMMISQSMADDTVIRVSFLLSVFQLTFLNASNQMLCSENDTLLEIPGDAILNGKIVN